MAMTHQQALEVLAAHRGQRIVITTMTSAGLFPRLSDTPLDFVYIPSAMGHGPALGLGLALAAPERGVVVVNGDGCTLMSLGSLVTLASNPANIVVIVMENGLYEVTGGQALPGGAHTDFPGLARAAGIARVATFDSLAAWQAGAATALATAGPACIVLKIEGRLGQKTPKAPRPMAEQIRRLQEALGVAR